MTSTLEKLRRLPADGNLVALAIGYITSPAFESSFAAGAGFLFVFGHNLKLKAGRDISRPVVILY
jgi:hypothetical protein